MKKIKNQKSIVKNKSYNNEEKIIFQRLPEVKERNEKAYIITFILIFVIMYSDWLNVIVDILGISSLPTAFVFAVNIIKVFISIVILFVILKDTFKRDVKYYQRNWKEYIKYGISTLIVFGFIGMLASGIIRSIIGSSSENETYVKSMPLLYQIIFGVILSPIIEEGIFRGLLKKIFKNKYMFLGVSSVFFGAMHVIFDIANSKNLLYIFTYSISGLALAYNYEKTDNLVSPIVMHMINNLLSVVLSVALF